MIERCRELDSSIADYTDISGRVLFAVSRVEIKLDIRVLVFGEDAPISRGRPNRMKNVVLRVLNIRRRKDTILLISIFPICKNFKKVLRKNAA